MTGNEVTHLIAIIDQAYNRRSWHGTNLRGAISRVKAAQAVWRPAPGRHNIWEVTVHAAYWKYTVWRRITGGARGGFPLKGSNWFVTPEDPSEEAWQADIALLEKTHNLLRQALASLTSEDLYHTPEGGKETVFTLASGIAAHDLYHAGQIQLLKRLSATPM